MRQLGQVWLGVLWLVLMVGVVGAQEPTELPVFERSVSEIEERVKEGEIELTATDAGGLESEEASGSGIVAKITDKGTDLTEPKGEAQGKLGELLLEQNFGRIGPMNFLRQGMKAAVMRGVPANILVLILLFPVVTAIIAASRHLVGIRGFGIFTPALVSVGFLATGITSGILLFLVIIVVASLGGPVIKKLRLPYLPRTSLLLWVVSMAVLALLLAAPYVGLEVLTELSIFPVLVLVLLAETFIDVQNKKGMDQAVEMTMETLILAVVAYVVMKMEVVQEFVLLNPEVTIVGTAAFNIFLGRFAGLRLLEYVRFRSLLK